MTGDVFNPLPVANVTVLADGRREVTYSLGPADRVTVVLARTDDADKAIAETGALLASQPRPEGT